MQTLLDALTSEYTSFFRYALAMGALSSVAFGIIGTYVVARRISYIAGAISHSALGGIGAALYCQHKYGAAWYFDPVFGALLVALLSGIIIGLVSLYARQREDTVIGAVWAVGMAAGLLFIDNTPGYVEPMSYLFGRIVLVSHKDLWLVAGLDLLIVALGVAFYHKFLAVCFDEEFAELRGLNVKAWYLLLLCLTALTVVLLVKIVGIVMVVALLTLPAAIAGQFSKRLWHMMILSVIVALIFTIGGICVSYAADTITGPTIIVVAGGAYLLSVIVKSLLHHFRSKRSVEKHPALSNDS
ncbi:MAG: metal ABC transporter permease [Candidatus Sumerlaeota bacterium]